MPGWQGARNCHIDETKVAANAGFDSLHPRFAVEAHLAHLFAADDAAEDAGDDERNDGDAAGPGGGDEPARWLLALTDEARAALAADAAARHD